MLQTSRFKLLGGPAVRHSTRADDEPRAHPLLSALELECLAQQISTVDGVTPSEARRQIAEFTSADPTLGTARASRRRQAPLVALRRAARMITRP